ncbi:MAG TPA: hypothetical protein VKH19_13275 [Gemmatimonadaceae bacterium]|nr:hypothetical protein [Gemmatimonadaceae bacterium]
MSSTITTGTTQSSAANAANSTIVTATASCPAGKSLFGGGGRVVTSNGTNPGKVAIQQSYPSAATTWTAVGVVTQDGGNGASVTSLGAGVTMDVTAYVICSS